MAKKIDRRMREKLGIKSPSKEALTGYNKRHWSALPEAATEAVPLDELTGEEGSLTRIQSQLMDGEIEAYVNNYISPNPIISHGFDPTVKINTDEEGMVWLVNGETNQGRAVGGGEWRISADWGSGFVAQGYGQRPPRMSNSIYHLLMDMTEMYLDYCMEENVDPDYKVSIMESGNIRFSSGSWQCAISNRDDMPTFEDFIKRMKG